MLIPTLDKVMLPMLRLCAEKTWFMRELVVKIEDELALTDEQRSKETSSGGMTVISNRINWAKTYLKKAGLLEQPKRAYVQASSRGREVLKTNPTHIDTAFLLQFSEFRSFYAGTRSSDEPVVSQSSAGSSMPPSATPDEQLDAATQTLDESLREALLARILDKTPAFFEKMIIDLLLGMKYGGSRADAGEQLGKTGDGGVDGIIREDELGLDRIYLQAKQYAPGNTVGSEAVRAFVGALVGKGAQKGVLITTSTFSASAQKAAEQSGALRIRLIDGTELTKLMIRHNVGVRVAKTIEIKRVDLDYFETSETE